MHADTGLLAAVGSLCMMLALLLAWCLALVRSSRFVKRCFPNAQYLLKAHLDVLMTGVGSLGNPSGFLAVALKPDLPQRPATPFGALMVFSVTATTVAYGGAAWYVAHAVFHAAT